ncbi:MAG: redox-sensing transcriptional repressor Rex [Pirellulaceae bacterium]|nr:redox-sensing transcriptional repressor Rex [Pirellulaceae bacterium]
MTKPPDIESTVPKAVVSRLSLYLRELQHIVRDGSDTTSSTQLGQLLGFSDAQVRKDLAYFGQFGYPGIGYKCQELITEIKKIMGTNRAWPVVLVGMGNLGRALLGYKGFEQQGFHVVAAFEVNPKIIGTQIEGIDVYHIRNLREIVINNDVKLAIVAVPSGEAQSIAEELVQAGIDGILNFAPVTITVPDNVSAVGVDLAIELEQLSFAVVNQTQKP